MSTIASATKHSHLHQPQFQPQPVETWRSSIGEIDSLVADLQQTTAPVWPLADYVAVHPYLGWLDHNFAQAHMALRTVSDCELLPRLEVLANQFQSQRFELRHVQAAAEQMLAGSESVHQFIQDLTHKLYQTPEPTDEPNSGVSNILDARAHVSPVSRWADVMLASEWTDTIHHEVGKFCVSYYDEGQASCGNPFKSLPLFAAWKEMASVDRSLEILGVHDFRKLVGNLPNDALSVIAYCLTELEVPERLWKEFLLSHCLALPGWFAWTRYQTESNMRRDNPQDDFADLLAIQLVYDLGLKQAFALPIAWDAYNIQLPEPGADDAQDCISPALLERQVLLRAGELAFREQVLSSLKLNRPHLDSQQLTERKLAQLVFCIDVRSERMRRHFESVSGSIETLGFAGFFGVPMAYQTLGSATGCNQLPVLLTPKIQVQEGLVTAPGTADIGKVSALRQAARVTRKLWKQFQSATFSCFAFVESMGWLYGWQLAKRTLGLHADHRPQLDGLPCAQAKLGPTLIGLEEQGFGIAEQVKLAESILRNLGLTSGFARLVTFCGHASQTTNNPLAASLDCGACGGHSGEANARFAAVLLNQPAMRAELRLRGIDIPVDTHFLAAVHNTTTDAVEFFDVAAVPASHQPDLSKLQAMAIEAGRLNKCERAATFAETSPLRLDARSRDWSEVRPEWGLAGNAAFIVAPRPMTQFANLDGRTFLHSYDHHHDPDGSVLELIMTAPMVVAHWINMQYFASAVDPQHFSSGSKTIHNVAGQFGVVAGNGGDLCIGLPLESLHNGVDLVHQPLRLLAVIAAPRASILKVVNQHHLLQQIFKHEWMHLVAVDDGVQYQLTSDLSWIRLQSAI